MTIVTRIARKIGGVKKKTHIFQSKIAKITGRYDSLKKAGCLAMASEVSYLDSSWLDSRDLVKGQKSAQHQYRCYKDR
jgi:hypothetical protein